MKSENTPFASRTLFLFAIFIPMFLIRAYSIFHILEIEALTLAQGLVVFRGFLSDFVIAVVMAQVGIGLKRVKWIGRFLNPMVVVVFSSLLFVANFEHIKVNYANADFSFVRYALSKELIGGSLFSQGLMIDFVFCCLISMALFFGLRRLKLNDSRKMLKFVVCASVLLLLVIPTSLSIPKWIGTNVFEDNLGSLAHRVMHLTEVKKKTLREELRTQFYQADLSGTWRMSQPKPVKTNVLILALEGLNYDDYVKGRYPHFKEQEGNTLFIPQFIAHQKQTDRGLYSLFCGDYPNLIEKDSKTSLLSLHFGEVICLPKILVQHGYQTEFIQGSPLGFMKKDKFAEMAGFEVIKGYRDFTSSYSANDWGVDDKTLLEQVYRDIQSMNKSEKPWMIGVLTTSTHHPYNVPSSFLSHAGPPDHADAKRYMDEGVYELLKKLEADGTLKNTLVIITGDEASPFETGATIFHQVGINRLLFQALTPEHDRGVIMDIFTQSDLLISVCDYLGFPQEARLGRSLFREYKQPRDIIFSNILTDRIFRFNHALNQPPSLLTCSHKFDQCEAMILPVAEGNRIPVDPKLVEELKELAEYNDVGSGDLNTNRLFEEYGTQYNGTRFIAGSFRTTAKKGDTIMWSTKVTAQPSNKSPMAFAIWSYVPDPKTMQIGKEILQKVALLIPGQTLDYSHVLQVQDSTIETWTNIKTLGANDQIIQVDKALIRKWSDLPSSDLPIQDVVSGSLANQEVDLMKIPLLPDFIGTLSPEKTLILSQIPLKSNMFPSYPFYLTKNSNYQLQITLEGIRGQGEIASAFLNAQMQPLQTDLKTLKEQQKTVLEINHSPTEDSPAPVALYLGVQSGEPTTSFRILSATLKLSQKN